MQVEWGTCQYTRKGLPVAYFHGTVLWVWSTKEPVLFYGTLVKMQTGMTNLFSPSLKRQDLK